MKLYDVKHYADYCPNKKWQTKKEGYTYIQVVAQNPNTARELAEKYLREECDSNHYHYIGYDVYDTWKHYHVKEEVA
jgi:hypothetical protein